MIRRTTKIQLVAFALISVFGIFYVGANYVGIHFLTPGPYTVSLTLPETGGIFPNAEVTERGVTVGRVASMRNVGDQVVVDLAIDHDRRIPADVHATVANLSAVGEQYVDLSPRSDGGPYLHDGSHIDATNATVPVDDATLLLDLDKLVNSVDRKHLATVVDELGKAFNDVGPALQRLIDDGNALTDAAIQNLPAQLRLIDDSVTVLDTQRDVKAELKAWASTFASFSDQLVRSDTDLRNIFDQGVAASHQLAGLLKDNESALPVLLGNLITVNEIQAVRLPYVRATLSLFPAQAAGGFFVTPGDGTAHFGQVNDNNYKPCRNGYQSTKLRGNNEDGSTPSDWGGPANLNAYCQNDNTRDYRGSRFVPRPDNAQVTNADPYPGPRYGSGTKHPTQAEQESHPWRGRGSSGSGSSSGSSSRSSAGGGRAIPLPYDPSTGLVTGTDGRSYQLGYSGPLEPIFGSSSWEWLLIAPTMR